MALSTQGFVINKLTISQILSILPNEPNLLKEHFFKDQEIGHPLGIGWNKIEFHRDFCRYSGLITASKTSGDYKLSVLGETIAQYDPNLADLSTWWLIHINLVLDKDTNVYSALFSTLPNLTLSKDEIIRDIVTSLGPSVSAAIIKKDVEAILRWMTDSPLGSLGTLVTDGKNWKRRKPSRAPSPYLIAYSALELHRRSKGNASSSRISELVKGPGSLSSIFQLDDGDLKAGLRQAQALLTADYLSVSDTAGLDTVYFGNNSSVDIARKYYLSHHQLQNTAS